jgi:TRAP-type C4-dicarboxylate transport system substrate-binding protein
MMNRKVFERLPAAARDLIRRHSGEWAAARFIETYAAVNTDALEQIKSDARRSVVVPNAADADLAHRAFQSVIDGWASNAGHNRELVSLVDAEIARIRSAE